MIAAVVMSVVILFYTVHVSDAATKYVCQSDGSDGDDGSTAALAKATINAGIGVMSGGDTLEICAGTYNEFIIGSANGTLTVPGNILATQPGTKVLPSGVDVGHKTRIVPRTGATVILSPTVVNQETSTIVLFYQTFTSNVEFDGINFIVNGPDDEQRTAGVFLGDSTSVTVKNGEVKGGGVKASSASNGLVIENMHVHDVGYPWCNYTNGNPHANGQPCPHGMYMCGDNHVVRGNWIHHTGDSGVHLTCEQSNGDNNVVRENVITDLPGYGVIIDGNNGLITANRIERVGIGIFPVASTTKTLNNTISSYYTETPGYVPDPFAIMYFSAGVIRNNLILSPKSAFNAIAQQQFAAINTGQVHHNLCTVGGNAGCTLTGTTANLVTNYGGGVFTLLATSPARGAGVTDIALTTDIVGLVYPSPPDIGAYAYSAGGDVTVPTVSVTAPTGGATVSGTVNVTASASDNVAVAGVQFKVDGGNVDSEDVVSSYGISWNTLAVSNGVHVLTAVARDAAGNSTTSAGVSVTVNNVGLPDPAVSRPRPTSMFLSR